MGSDSASVSLQFCAEFQSGSSIQLLARFKWSLFYLCTSQLACLAAACAIEGSNSQSPPPKQRILLFPQGSIQYAISTLHCLIRNAEPAVCCAGATRLYAGTTGGKTRTGRSSWAPIAPLTDILPRPSASFCPAAIEGAVMRTSTRSATHITPQQSCALMTYRTAVRRLSTVPLQQRQPIRLIVDSSLYMHAAFIPNSSFRFSAVRAIQYVEASKSGAQGGQYQRSTNYQGLIQEVVYLSEGESRGEGLLAPSTPPSRRFTNKTELLGIYEALAALLRACRIAGIEQQLQRVCRIVVENDSTAAVMEATSVMSSLVPPECPVHEALWSLQQSHSIPIEFRHLPRSSREGRLADAMSRWQQEEWQVEPEALASAVECALMTLSETPGRPRTWPPDVDVFGSERSRLDHCRYYAYMWDRQSAGANTWDLDWSKWPEEALYGRLELLGLRKARCPEVTSANLKNHCQNGKPVCFAFPHPKHAQQAMGKIARDKPTIWLVLKETMTPLELATLGRLPVNVTVPIRSIGTRGAVVRPVGQHHGSVNDADPWATPFVLHFISWE